MLWFSNNSSAVRLLANRIKFLQINVTSTVSMDLCHRNLTTSKTNSQPKQIRITEILKRSMRIISQLAQIQI